VVCSREPDTKDSSAAAAVIQRTKQPAGKEGEPVESYEYHSERPYGRLGAIESHIVKNSIEYRQLRTERTV
jgi:hypothetical protein